MRKSNHDAEQLCKIKDKNMPRRPAIARASAHRHKTLTVVLENPKFPINVASIIRTVDALSVGKLYIITDKWSSFEQMRKDRFLKAGSTGSSKWQYCRIFPDTESCIAHLRKSHYSIISTTPHTTATKWCPLGDAPVTYPKLAVVFGNETFGVSPQFVEASLFCTGIEMFGFAESLNISVAVGVFMSTITAKRLEFSTTKRAKKRAKQLANMTK